MKCILMRHSEALDRDVANVPFDADRPLSELGKVHAQLVGEFLASQGIYPDPVVCSPFIRTQESAAITCKALGSGVEPRPVTILAPGSSTDELLRAMVNYREPDSRWFMAVIHEPDISLILGNLLCSGKSYPMPVYPGDMFILTITTELGQSRGSLGLSFSPMQHLKGY